MTDPTATVQVKHRYRHTPEAVFDAWLTPEIAGKFLFATPTGTMVRAEIDPRVGGRFLFVDRRDGQDVAHFGDYLEIDRPRRLVFAFAVTGFEDKPTKVTVEVAPAPGGAEVTLTHEGVIPDYAERTQGGWSMILAALETALG